MSVKPVQRYILLGLTFLVLLNGTGYFALAWLETGYHRLFAQNGESSEETVSLTLNSKEFRAVAWIGKKDFIWKGKVYDCERISHKKGAITLVCTLDSKESSIRDSVAANCENDRNQPASSKPAKSKIPVFPVFPVFGSTSIIPLFKGDTVAFNLVQDPAFETPVFALCSPPPDHC